MFCNIVGHAISTPPRESVLDDRAIKSSNALRGWNRHRHAVD
jgi:hypothetical protein